MTKLTRWTLLAPALLTGCIDERQDPPVVSRDTFAKLSCANAGSAESFASGLSDLASSSNLVVSIHKITAGDPGEVVQVVPPKSETRVILTFVDGESEMLGYAVKSGEPTAEDHALVARIARASPDARCSLLKS